MAIEEEGSVLMDCEYRSNPLCSKLAQEGDCALCGKCWIRRYAKGQWLQRRYWGDDLAICLDGMMAMGELQDGHLITRGLACGGFILNYGVISDRLPRDYVEESLFCVTDCVVASFPPDIVGALMRDDIGFVRAVMGICLENCSRVTLPLFRSVGNGDAYEAIRYICLFCREHGIPQLTHEQIALVCNRSRPTVTKELHKLLRNEPEIFQTNRG